jgi:serine/threonine-protein kinase LATS1/2
MSLLIKKGVFEEELARFYIAELTCAIDSVHKMGFIHRYAECAFISLFD